MNVKKGKRYYEKNRNILIAISALLIVSTIILFIFIKESCHDAISYAGPNERETNRGVIIKVYEDSFAFMSVEGEPCYVIYWHDAGPFIDPKGKHKGKLKEGQEVVIVYSGHILKTEPKTIHDVGKIYIRTEESNITIPNNIYELFQDY